ncbi:beta-hexosaminidase subunit beta-like [Engraulis encrasicolus]|uniref:beta-hexosaminidase subunit beta-like n=1 Tax=Engraulis encrasicolus TaxID=184585 RepID=UPI002FD5904D
MMIIDYFRLIVQPYLPVCCLQHKPDYVVQVWKAECYLCKLRKVTKAGLRAILSAPWYLDLPGPTHDWARHYNVRPLAFMGQSLKESAVE